MLDAPTIDSIMPKIGQNYAGIMYLTLSLQLSYHIRQLLIDVTKDIQTILLKNQTLGSRAQFRSSRLSRFVRFSTRRDALKLSPTFYELQYDEIIRLQIVRD